MTFEKFEKVCRLALIAAAAAAAAVVLIMGLYSGRFGGREQTSPGSLHAFEAEPVTVHVPNTLKGVRGEQ